MNSEEPRIYEERQASAHCRQPLPATASGKKGKTKETKERLEGKARSITLSWK